MYIFSRTYFFRKFINYLFITNNSIFVVTIDSIIIRWFSFNYYVTFICCAIFSFRKTINRNSTITISIVLQHLYRNFHLFIYLFIILFTKSISQYFFFALFSRRHDFDIVLIFHFMRLFRHRWFHVRYRCFQNFLTHLSNSSKSYFLLQMIFANRTNSWYSNKTNSTTNQIRWLKSNNWIMHSDCLAINEAKFLAKTKTKTRWWYFLNKTNSFDSTTNRQESQKSSYRKKTLENFRL